MTHMTKMKLFSTLSSLSTNTRNVKSSIFYLIVNKSEYQNLWFLIGRGIGRMRFRFQFTLVGLFLNVVNFWYIWVSIGDTFFATKAKFSILERFSIWINYPELSAKDRHGYQVPKVGTGEKLGDNDVIWRHLWASSPRDDVIGEIPTPVWHYTYGYKIETCDKSRDGSCDKNPCHVTVSLTKMWQQIKCRISHMTCRFDSSII